MDLVVIRREEAFVPYMVVAENRRGTRLLRPVPERYARAAVEAWKMSRNPDIPKEPEVTTLLPVSETVPEKKRPRAVPEKGGMKPFAVQVKRTVHRTRLPHWAY